MIRLIPVRTVFAALCGIAGLTLTLSCSSTKQQPDLVVDRDEGDLTIAISTAAAQAVVEGLIGDDLDCNSEIDGEMESLLRSLDEGGPRSRASMKDGETIVEARRRGGRLDLKIRGSGSGKIEATMPWAVGECLLGRRIAVDEAIRSSIKVKVTNENGGSFSFRLD